MATCSTERLVPITRSFLSSYYNKYPFSLSDDVRLLLYEVESLSAELDLQIDFSIQGQSRTINESEYPIPHKIDENLWRNREHIEEILFLLERSHFPQSLQGLEVCENDKHASHASLSEKIRVKFQTTLNMLVSFQSKQSEHVFNTVMTYMPQDFRGTLIRQQKERSERNRQAKIDNLVTSGGSIGDRYALLWKQQMERRTQLAQLGSATGVYKTLVKYLVGVPQVLLDFVRQINDDHGPMEEQRQHYGPPMYTLTKMVLSIRCFLSLLSGSSEAATLTKSKGDILERAVDVYTSEFERFIKFIGEVFANSPFFITAEEAGALESSDDYKETVILAGKTYEVLLTVESTNSYIAWDFSLANGKMNADIGFSVEYENPSGEKTLILPYRRYGSNQGNFCTCMAGNYKLVWDNSYSTFFKKVLTYKVDCIPPVDESK